MSKTTFSNYAIDNASLFFLSLIRKDHTNTFRFTMTFTEDISPEILQMAVNRVYRRFPTIIAGFRPGWFRYLQVPSEVPPQVQEDPGTLLPMRREELHSCAYRVFYSGKNIIIEAFHALTDGYGAVASFTTLASEYLRLKYGVSIPIEDPLVDIQQAPLPCELTDSFLEYKNAVPKRIPTRHAYQLPGEQAGRNTVHIRPLVIPTATLLCASRRYGVSITTLLSSVMASSIMEIQKTQGHKTLQPVRIMVPVDLRRIFPSRTFRNFVLYALPTMEPHDDQKNFQEQLQCFSRQMQQQITEDSLSSIIAYNVRTQCSWSFRCIPLFLKRRLMQLIDRYFGGTTSSITVTNVGAVSLPKEMSGYVTHIDAALTPRIRSPYDCAIISYNGQLTINLSRFPEDSRLEEIFLQNLKMVLQGESAV